jgi:hypothetical protein
VSSPTHNRHSSFASARNRLFIIKSIHRFKFDANACVLKPKWREDDRQVRMVVHPSVPVTTVPEFIAYATANPGKVTMASSGNGTSQSAFTPLGRYIPFRAARLVWQGRC